jgi:hypothetical protein
MQRLPSTQMGTAPGAAPAQHVVPMHEVHGQVMHATAGSYPRQFPCTHTSSRPQRLAQSPQWSGLVCVFTHAPLQSWTPVARMQFIADWHVPVTHACPAMQRVPSIPQLAGSV